MIPKVKICCISSLQEAELAIKYGASAIGLVSEMPSGPGVISEETIEQIATSLPSNIDTFLLTSKQDVASIIKQLKKCKTKTVQIVDRLTDGSYSDIKTEFPNINIVQVIHVNNLESINEAIHISKYVDTILLDSGNQQKEIKLLGGTGKTHNWELSKKIVESVRVPVYLAGGLDAHNIIEAVEMVKPYGIDLCSGVRTNNKLDENKVKEFFQKLSLIS
ncbi:MAG: phosphoribosylanthranilate isomerase [Melioribacteraceae bacterium]